METLTLFKRNRMNELEKKLRNIILENMKFDPAHDIKHIERVVNTAKRIAEKENGDLNVIVPAAWLHDCVNVSKDSPDRDKGSLFSADKAIEVLKNLNYPEKFFKEIHHAIHAHSYSANIETKTLSAKILQDADRLDAIGAIGVARCIAYSTSKNKELYSYEDPFCENREPNEIDFAVDHFYTKLLKLKEKMNTREGLNIALKREQFMLSFLDNLKREISL
tara:strand:+ start:22590 stop:23252 length:663 start_codon:yes stop_codon:yes gene_type:complete